jgi:hypothetical protein
MIGSNILQMARELKVEKAKIPKDEIDQLCLAVSESAHLKNGQKALL